MRQIVKRVSARKEARFAAVGVINTLIDFVVLNLLTAVLGWPRIPSNIISTSAAMVFSFWANKVHVFKQNKDNNRRQAILFILGTVFGLYVLQTIVITVFSEAWLWPRDVADSVFSGIGLGDTLSDDFITTNVAKLLATVVTLTWNYWFYSKYVFIKEMSEDEQE